MSVTSRMLLLVRAWPWLLALLVLAPVLAPGYVLSYDMVFVPDLAMRSDFLGLGSGLPRAVPSDAVVAVLDEVLPGMVLQKVVLFGALVLAGTGARRLVPGGSPVAQLAATSLYVWNPYVAERLVIGHWPTLLAYAALPFVVDAGRRWRDGERALPALVLWLLLGALSPAGGVVTGVAALVFGLRRPQAAQGRNLALLGAVAAVNAPWVVAGLLHAGAAVTDPVGAEVFAAGPEGRLPTVFAVLGLGGVWNAEVVPASRLGMLGWVSLVVVVALCAAGARSWWSAVDRRTRWGTVVCAGLGLTVALAGSLAPHIMAALVAEVPGGGLLRDGSRFLPLLAIGEAALFGSGAAVVAGLLRDRTARRALAVGGVLVPLAMLPDLALGVGGRLQPVAYPPAYAAGRSALDQQRGGGGGDVLVLPFTSYRAPAWNGGRRVLDPLGRYLDVNYVASDVLSVSGKALAGEDPRVRAAARALDLGSAARRSTALAQLGIGYVVTDRAAAGTGAGIEVVTLDGPVTRKSPALHAWIALAAAWSVWLLSMAVAGVLTLRQRRLRKFRR